MVVTEEITLISKRETSNKNEVTDDEAKKVSFFIQVFMMCSSFNPMRRKMVMPRNRLFLRRVAGTLWTKLSELKEN